MLPLQLYGCEKYQGEEISNQHENSSYLLWYETYQPTGRLNKLSYDGARSAYACI